MALPNHHARSKIHYRSCRSSYCFWRCTLHISLFTLHVRLNTAVSTVRRLALDQKVTQQKTTVTGSHLVVCNGLARLDRPALVNPGGLAEKLDKRRHSVQNLRRVHIFSILFNFGVHFGV